MRALRSGERGATLVELLVVLVVGAVIVGAASQTVIGALVAQRRQVARVEALNAATVAFERLTRDLRGADPLLASPTPSRVALTTWRAGVTRDVTLSLEPDGAGAFDVVVRDPGRRVLLRSVASDAAFAYLDADGAPLPAPVDPEEVAAVTVDLVVTLPESQASVELSDHITLRNARTG